MHKKDYVTFARMIRTQKHRILVHSDKLSILDENYLSRAEFLKGSYDAVERLSHDMADIFGNDNANFHRGKFMQACEIDTESK